MIVSVLFFGGTCCDSYASGNADPDYALKLGPKFGYDFFSTQFPLGGSPGIGSRDIGYGFTTGIALRNEWKRRWYIESGMLLSYGYSPTSVSTDHTMDTYSVYDMERAALIMPVHLGFRFDVVNKHGMSLFLGGWGSCGLAGRLDGDDRLPKYGLYGSDGVWKRWALGVAMGLTFEISDNVSVAVDGHLGLSNMAKRAIFTCNRMNESAVMLGIAYWIPRKKGR